MKRLSLSCLFSAAAVLLFLPYAGCGTKEQASPSSNFKESSADASFSSSTRSFPWTQESSSQPEESGEEKALLSVVTGPQAFVYPSKEGGDPIDSFSEGVRLQILDDSDEAIWFEVTLEDGSKGFLYGETVFPLNEAGEPASSSLSAQRISQSLEELEELFPEGKYWNHMGSKTEFGTQTPFSVTDTPCEHSVWGETWCNIYNGVTLDYFPEYGYLSQCMGFASFLSDQTFTAAASVHLFYDLDLLRPGDHIRLHDYEHSMIVTEITEEGVRVGEVNENYEDCLISWSRVVSFWELEDLAWDSTYISRYPMYREEDGSYSFWEA